MPSINVQVIDVGQPTRVPTARGGYNAIEVAYKKDGKIEGKKIVDFASKVVFDAVKQMRTGESYDVTLEKDKNDYWQWTGITPTQSAGGSDGVAKGSNGKSENTGSYTKPTGRVTGSNYETPDERARRQVLIVRQSSLSNAIALLIHNNPKLPVDSAGVLALAEQFTDWVFTTPPLQAIAQMPDDKVE